MRDIAGPRLREGIGAEQAMEVASRKMMELGATPFETDRVRAEASDTHWKEYVLNVMTTEGRKTNAWSTIARQRIRSSINHMRKETQPIQPDDP